MQGLINYKPCVYKLFLFILFISAPLYTQNIYVTGKITDTLQNPLEYANLLAIPNAESQTVKFAISKHNGQFKLALDKNQSYNITVSYLGHKPQTLSLNTTDKDLVKNFVLLENPNQLDEITLNYIPPISVKKDTITYKVDAFITGEERKLREVLKKLPGVEVDRAGNVKVQGKKITKVLVEDKTFFTGNSKLAVNNIPADAVDQVVVLDNYSEIAMLKGLEDSNDMALNIKLKEDKKQFAFGDVEVGGGIKERYVIHPNLFYYSPKTNVNFIGDLNNTGIKSFTFHDYIEFEGGFSKLLQNSRSQMSLLRDDFARHLNQQDFRANTNQFGALNIRQSLTNNIDVNAYIIASNSLTETTTSTLNNYQNMDTPFLEERTVTNNLDNFFTISKITVIYKPSYEEELKYNNFLKTTNARSDAMILTLNQDQNNHIQTLSDIIAFQVKQNLSYSRKLSKKHTAILETSYSFQNDKPVTEWLTNEQILQGLIPLEDDVMYNILQTKRSKSHDVTAVAKDYWVLNKFNHLYTCVGANVSHNSFHSLDGQELTNGSFNNFNKAGFGNDFRYQFFNTFLGLEYKFQLGIATFKPMLYYHFYNWNTQQFDEKNTHNKGLLLPKFTVKMDFNKGEKLNFKYNLNARFPAINQLANNFILSSFNSAFKGNSLLGNQLYHTANLRYYKFNMYHLFHLNLTTSFNKRLETVKITTQLNGIESYNSPVLFFQPEHSWNISGAISKQIHKIKYEFSSDYAYNDFYQLLNDNTQLNISKSISGTFSAETRFQDHPNLELRYTKNFNRYNANENSNNFENDRIEAILQYDFLNDFILKANYQFDNYKNESLNLTNTFDIANASLFYKKEDSAWGFEIIATNLFDIKYKQQNSFNSYIVSDTKTFILPRILMFKLSYKL